MPGDDGDTINRGPGYVWSKKEEKRAFKIYLTSGWRICTKLRYQKWHFTWLSRETIAWWYQIPIAKITTKIFLDEKRGSPSKTSSFNAIIEVIEFCSRWKVAKEISSKNGDVLSSDVTMTSPWRHLYVFSYYCMYCGLLH